MHNRWASFWPLWVESLASRAVSLGCHPSARGRGGSPLSPLDPPDFPSSLATPTPKKSSGQPDKEREACNRRDARLGGHTGFFFRHSRVLGTGAFLVPGRCPLPGSGPSLLAEFQSCPPSAPLASPSQRLRAGVASRAHPQASPCTPGVPIRDPESACSPLCWLSALIVAAHLSQARPGRARAGGAPAPPRSPSSPAAAPEPGAPASPAPPPPASSRTRSQIPPARGSISWLTPP